MLRFLCALSVVLLLVAFESSCHKRRVAVPVPPPPASIPAPEESHPSTTTPAKTPAATQQPAAQPAPAAKEPPRYQVNRPPQSEPQPQQTPPPRRSSRPSSGTTAEPNAAGQPNPPPSNQAPRLGDILTPEQERQYNAAIDQSLASAQTSLGSLTNRQLTKEQQAVVAEIQSFIQQAQTTRKTNLPAARSLAERANVLARDLAGSLR
jgi:hypothetical protein